MSKTRKKMNKWYILILCCSMYLPCTLCAEQEQYTLEQVFRMAISDVQTQENGVKSQAAIETLKQLGPKIIPFLVHKLDHPLSPGQVRIQALITYWKSNSVPYLAASYTVSTNQRTRRAIIYYLGLIGAPGGGPVAEQELGNSRNRSTALWTIGKCGMTQGVSHAYHFLNSTQEMDRIRSIGLIRRVGTLDDIHLLIDMMNDPAWNVRSAAAGALEERGSGVCTALTNAWTSLSVPAKILTISILSEITNFYSAEVLKLYTSDTDMFVAAHAARILKMEDPKIFQTLSLDAPDDRKWLFGLP
jgi:HEAT repeat protein